MIEVKEILDDFEIIDVQTLSTEYGITDDRASIAVSLYNKALNKMNIGSYDSARIDLRKSVNMYPSFVESRMLLGVCLFALGDRSDAVGIFNSIKGDNRERALDYIEKLHELSTRPESASFKSVSRQSRVPDAVYSSDNKLDEIMNSSPKKNHDISKENIENDEDVILSDDSDVDVKVNVSVDEDTVNETQSVTEDNQSVIESESGEQADKFLETDIEYVKNIVSKEKNSDNVASYDTIRGQNRRQRQSSVSDDSQSNIRMRENDAAAQKKRNAENENLARAKRTISNLTIQKARITVLAMAIGLCCIILLIVVICVGVSNSKLKKEITELNEKVITLEAQSGANSNVPSENTNNGTNDGASNDSANNNENADVDSAEMAAKANTAYNEAKTLYDSGKYAEAADLLAETDLTYLDYETKSAAETLYKDSVEKFTNTYFNTMYSNVSQENWSAVIEYGLPVYTHNVERQNPSFTNGSAVCFNLGKAYESTGDKEKAKEFYQATINMYPTSDDAGYAEYRLSQL